MGGMKKPLLFFKADAIGPDERWITVKPNGPDAKGQPILIKEHPDGTASVIGGAGGKLNYLRLKGVKSGEDYKQSVAEKAKARREARKAQIEKDKALGIHDAKEKARQEIAQQKRQAQKGFIQTVADKMGWAPEDVNFDAEKYAGLSDKALAKLNNEHHQALLKKAKEAVALQRQNLVASSDARAEAGFGQVPLDTDNPDVLSVQDLDPINPDGAGLGFATDYKRRAANNGLSDAELQQEAEGIRAADIAKLPEEERKSAIRRGETARLVRQELEGIREPLPDVKPALVAAKDGLEMMKELKKLQAIEKQAAAANREIDTSVEPKAFVLAYVAEPEVDAKIAEDVANDLRTIKTRSFLDFVANSTDKPQEALAKHVAGGAFNSVNALALAVGGDALVDRSVVDVLGIGGAAQVLARRLANDLPAEEHERVLAGMEEYHVHHYMLATEDALNQARELQDEAKEIELGEVHSADDLAMLQELNARRRDAINGAHEVLGRTLGEMEGNAAIIAAMKAGKQEKLEVSLGHISIEDAVRQARALGLQRGQYTIETVAGNRFLTVNGAGMDSLAAPIQAAHLQQIRRNLDIIQGGQDEDDYLPLGIANRPDLAMNVKPGTAPRLALPFTPGEDMAQSVRDYIGGRAADGDAAGDIVADLRTQEFFDKAGPRADEYAKAIDELAPPGQRAEDLADSFESMADDFVGRAYGNSRSTLNRQTFQVDQKAVDALHRALSQQPAGIAAYKPIGELTGQDQRALREYFYQHIAKESADAGALRHELEELESQAPEKESMDMFGEVSQNPDWSQWKQARDEMAAKVNASSLNWEKYCFGLHGYTHAYAAIQDLIKGDVAKAFHENFNALNPDAPLKLGRRVIAHNELHADTVDPETFEARRQKRMALVDALRERSGGKYAAGGVLDKLEEARQQQAAFEQSQMGFFSDDMFGDAAPEEGVTEKAPELDERHTLGHEAERQIAGMMPIVGQNFKPGQPVQLWQPSMNGSGVARQRAVKMIEQNKRVGLSFGVGSGKTLIGLAGFTNLHQKGMAKRGLYLVPSIVQGQFGGEALRYLEPGKFNWHVEPGASREERIKAYKNPEHHFCVMTHAAFRDDMLHLGAGHAGISIGAMRDKLDAMRPPERQAWMKEVCAKEAIDFDYLMVDEGHDLLNREGKQNSGLANVVDSFSANTPYYVNASGDPIKNDVSEAYDALAKMAPGDYQDRDAFMRRYGANALSSGDAIKREMSRFFYPSRIDPEVTADKQEVKLPLSEGQKKSLAEMEKHAAAARIARMQGKVDVKALQALSPASFASAPAAEHEAVAKRLQDNLGILKDTAIQNVLNNHDDNAKLDYLVQHAAARKGKPGVVFAHSLAAVEKIKAKLEAEGHRVVALTGKDSSKEKERKRQLFNPETGDAGADILIASDAGATGMNVQRGQWLVQYDTPMTAKTHAQRQGRIFRTGQKNNVELTDLIADHAAEHKARARLKNKYALRDLMTSPMDSLDDSGLAYFLKQRQETQQDSLF